MKTRNNKRWNKALFFMATAVFIAMILYSNALINNIREEERRKVSVWADAITYRADLVSYMDDFFKTIRVAESKRAALLVKAMQKVNDAPLHEDPSFYLEVIASNSTIPSILTDAHGNINYTVNLDAKIANMKHISELGDKKSDFDSLIMPYYKDRYNILYYKESNIYSNLRTAIDNLVEVFFQEIVINDASVPVIVTDSTMRDIITYGMINPEDIQTDEAKAKLIKHFLSHHKPIQIELPHQGVCYVLYDESPVLMQLRYYPIIQFIIIFIFAVAAYLIFTFARRYEQNRVWVGMSKETAHQLGTPISSLLAWSELLKEQEVDPAIMKEIDKDVHRLETIAQRFSKIGSEPELENENIATVIEEFIGYLQSRISSKVAIKVNRNDVKDFDLPINKYLFEWVIENLCKNSVDAMNGNGVIIIDLSEDEKNFFVDISDTGKGIPSNQFNLIFQPGYTTKKRGWGLGLPLAKRIIQQYHKGKLFVKSSVIGRGTVMRIQFRK
ncbi:MAG: HAMP domain-containing histidine kinase [Bacteroidetes bacterium]|nr:HAMP domain-containing histidine kinase [Bacteroidota bacterium]MCL2301763.1 HAMP domain-containing histidine kinase [Lentimicrobiaceae bacterium]